MSVYTPVSTLELQTFLAGYNIGPLVSYQGIENGITNSNFWLATETGLYVLTLYEHHRTSDLDYILGLQNHLGKQGLACATPVKDGKQRFYSMLNNKPAAINHRLKGKVCQNLSTQHCTLIGQALAKFHLFGKGFKKKRVNPCGEQWRFSMQQKLMAAMSSTDQELLAEELQAYQIFESMHLPKGPTHSDLFHDNCLFDGNQFCGIIDFDYACDESFLYDLAITINDCCIRENGELDPELVQHLISAYELLRPLDNKEQDHLHLMLRLGATRFWLSRLYDQNFPLPGEMTYTKDPDDFKNILLLRRALI